MALQTERYLREGSSVFKWIERFMTAAPQQVARRLGIRSTPGETNGKTISADDPRLSSVLRETAIQYLNLTQKYAFDCPSLQPSAFRAELRKIIAEYETEISAGEARSLQNQSGRSITNQWRRETEFLEDKEAELKSIVAMLTNEFSKADSENESFTRQLTESVAELRDAVEVDDIKQIRARINEVVARLASKIDHRRQRDLERIGELREQVDILQSRLHLSGGSGKTDTVTGLFNRPAFNDHLAAETRLAQRQDQPLSLVLCRMEQFELTAGTYGDLVADACLAELSNRLIKAFFHKTDFLARFESDCLAVLLSQTGQIAAMKAADSLMRDLARAPYSSPAGEIPLSISLSVVEYIPGEPAADLVNRSEIELAKVQADKDDDTNPASDTESARPVG